MKTADNQNQPSELAHDRLTSALAAKRLTVSVETLRAYVLTGQIVAIAPNGRGPGKRVYFDPAEIKAFALGGAEAARRYREERDAAAA